MFLHVRRSLIFALPLLALMLAGCATTDDKNVYAAPTPDYGGIESVPRLHIGDSVIITFEGPQDMIAPHEETIKEDGTVTLPYFGTYLSWISSCNSPLVRPAAFTWPM